MTWLENAENLHRTLNTLSAKDSRGREMKPDTAFSQWERCTHLVRETKRTVYLVGNGASASMASHVAADLAKNAHVHTEVFFDPSLLTALANDFGYEDVFAEPLRRRMREGDMLVAISSSGQSANILRACREAKNRGGIVITLSAMEAENRLRSEGIINFYLPAFSYGMAETSHAAILHFWLDRMAEKSKATPKGLAMARTKEVAHSWMG